MEVNYSADVSQLDQPAIDAAVERPGKPIRIRVPLLLFRVKPGETSSEGTYRSWNNVSWIVECANVEEAVAMREVLRAAFLAIEVKGIDTVHQLLTQAVRTE